MADTHVQDGVLRQAVTDELMAEINVLEAQMDTDALRRQAAQLRLPMQRRMAAEKKRIKTAQAWYSLARFAQTAAVVVLVLGVGFGGICLASPELREQLFALVEQHWGNHSVLKLTYTGTENDGQPEYTPTVAADDPRLENVWDKWCLHYYPLYLPGGYADGEKQMTMPEEVGELNNWNEDYINDAARARMLEIDEAAITFTSTAPSQRNAIRFIEIARIGARATYESEINEVSRVEIDGREVTVVQAGSSTRCYWQQDDHMLMLSCTLDMAEIEKIIANVERIR